MAGWWDGASLHPARVAMIRKKSEERAITVFHRGKRARVGGRQRIKPVAQTRDLIAVAHPGRRLVGHAGEQVVGIGNFEVCPAVFARLHAVHVCAQRLAGGLHAITDAQYRNT